LPVGAVLDHFGLDQVTLLGISLGGWLAIRAEAGEPRIARVISDDILTDFLACNLRQFPASARADAALLAGAEDHYVPLSQLADQISTLAAARSVTARVFARDAQAQNHVQADNIALSVQVILGWLDSIDRRDSQPGLTLLSWSTGK